MLGQALLTKRMGKTRVIAETGAGQHGVASATAAAYFGLDCTVYMGSVDTRRQALNVARMQLLGAKVVAGRLRQRHAQGRDQRGAARLGRQRRPHGVPLRHRRRPAPVPEHGPRLHPRHRRRGPRRSASSSTGALPDAIAACVGGGSNAIGLFTAFLDDEDVAIYGFEPGGDGVDTGAARRHHPRRRPRACCTAPAPTCSRTRTARPSSRTRSRPGSTTRASGPQHAHLAETGRATYRPVTDAEAMDALALLARTEGIIPAIESAHALAGALRRGARARRREGPTRSWSTSRGRGDKDMGTAREWFGLGEADAETGDQA